MPVAVHHDRAASDGWQAQATTIGRDVGVPVTAAIVVLTGVTVAAGFLVRFGFDGRVDAADVQFVTDLVAHRNPAVDGLTGIGTALAGTVTVAVLWVGAMVVAAIVTRRPTIPVFLLAAVGGEKLTYLLAALLVGRPRPPVESIGEVFATNSFPSGHVGSAVTLYGSIVVATLWYRRAVLGRRPPRPVPILLGVAVAVVAAFVAFSRVWRGHHHPSDVLWGALLGGAWLAWSWWSALRRSEPASLPAAIVRTRDATSIDRARGSASVVPPETDRAVLASERRAPLVRPRSGSRSTN